MSHTYEFGPFRIETRKRRLLRDGELVSLTPKAFETLLVLVQHSGKLLDKDDLMNLVWGDTAVEEANLTQNISVLRRALGDAPQDRKYIATVPGRGYRFIADVREVLDGEGDLILAKRMRARVVIEDVIETTIPSKSLCVLPFKSLSADAGDDYLGLGIADALITRLSNIRQVIVRPTSAVLRFTGFSQNPVAIGQELRVESVLEGSIRRDGNRIRVTVQLVGVRDEAPLWADKFDETFSDIFAVEDCISAQVAQALMLKMTGEEQKQITKRQTENPEAYQDYLKGLYYTNKVTVDGVMKGIEYYNRAIAIDPNYALAYAGLAEAYTWFSHLHLSPREGMPKARAAAIQALSIDDGLGEAHLALALVKMWYDREWSYAEREFEHAIDLNPNHSGFRQWYGYYLSAMGRFDEGIAELKKAQALDPVSLLAITWMGWILYFAHRYDQAIAEFEKAIEMDVSFYHAYWGLGWIYDKKGDYEEAARRLHKAMTLPGGGGPEIIAALGHVDASSGKREEARRLLDKLLKLASESYISPFYLSLVYVGLEEKDRALECLQKAYEDRFAWLVHLKVDPAFDCLHAEPQFVELLERLNLS
jgi:DNA-binding winged helix-turn-helix (wHTH) protein/tetratricopeptide (TPR) repeat protein